MTPSAGGVDMETPPTPLTKWSGRLGVELTGPALDPPARTDLEGRPMTDPNRSRRQRRRDVVAGFIVVAVLTLVLWWVGE